MQTRRILQYVKDNLLAWVVEELTGRSVLLRLVLINKQGLVGNAKIGGSRGFSDHKIVEFKT